MAKENKSIGFSKSTITEEDGNFILTEYLKDDTRIYNLSEKIREWIGIDGVTLKLSKDSEVADMNGEV